MMKRLCKTCAVQRGVFQCDGCSEIFCVNHVVEHQQDLMKNLDQIEEFRNEVQQILVRKSNKTQEKEQKLYDELVKIIDDWEQQSMIKIQRFANETREQLVMHTTGRTDCLKQKLEEISEELEQHRRRRDFLEPDLHSWMNRLDHLKKELIEPSKVLVQDDHTKLISKISVRLLDENEIFYQTSGCVDFEDNGKVVCLKTKADLYTEVRGQCEYSTGEHQIRLKIEQLNGWILFGIISKSTVLQTHSYTSKSCYGWYNGDHFVYAAGENLGGTGHDVIADDIVCLVINCDERWIRLTNERTNKTLKLIVDIQKCPFPWQLHLNLDSPETRLRIIS